MGIDELSNAEIEFLYGMYASMDDEQMYSLGILAKWKPSEIDAIIASMELCKTFFENIQLCASGRSEEIYQEYVTEIAAMIETLEQYNEHARRQPFYDI